MPQSFLSHVLEHSMLQEAMFLLYSSAVPHLQVPDQTRPPLSGTQSREQQEMQRWAHREPQVRYPGQHPSVRHRKKRDEYTVKTFPEKRNHNTLSGGRSQRAMRPVGSRIFSAFRLSELSGGGHAWTFSTTMGMFYLCTFLFSKQRPGDTEVHLMTNCTYL